MKKGTPFLFCRYSFHIGEDSLDATGLHSALNEMQGRYYPQGAAAEKRGEATIVVMRPQKMKVGKEDVVSWIIGHKPGHRTVADYDSTKQEIKYSIEQDKHIIHSAVIAIPRLGALAVSDRINALNMGGRPALSRTKAAIKKIDGGAFEFWFLEPGDVKAIVDDLDLQEYSFTVRRINPTAPGVLSAALDATYKEEGIGIHRGSVKPMPGEEMIAKEGLIEATSELAGAGYGVLGFKGETKTGYSAQIKKPQFSMDKKENLKQQAKAQPLRIFIESEGKDDTDLAGIVGEIVRFYDRDDTTNPDTEPT